MKHFPHKTIAFLILKTFLLLSPLCALANETYTLDPNHTYILWHANHFGFSNPSGKWLARGTLVVDKENLGRSKINVTIDMRNITTGVPELDKHLKGKLFFDVDDYPTATFVSTFIDANSQGIREVEGILTLHGVSKPVKIEAKINKTGINPVTDQKTIGFSGKATILRSDFGIKTIAPGISDEIMLNIEGEAFQSK